ncbi:MAG: PH domain-containing protein [Candidatus Lokiarchaeota archaeon]|nr:PH domain-containing protein [Candidatus Lokiarchaeota archaeon]MBD3341758.1 PH domain-containing protein [Candidatus Lokiarchaeota archaeon]
MGLISGLRGNAGVVDQDKLYEEVGPLLVEGEEIGIGFKVLRDKFIFTNYRLIIMNKQGLTGKKVDYLSILYSAISRYSIETSGHFDLDAELKIWISSQELPILDQKFNKKVNIYDLQKVLATHLFGDANTL